MTRSSRRRAPAAFGLSALLASGIVFAAESEPAPGPGPGPGRTIDIAQVKARADEAFAAADKDGNSTLSREEFAAMKPVRFHDGGRGGMHRKGMGMDGGGMGAGGMPGGMHRMGPPSAEERAEIDKALFAALDADGNGALSPEEFGKHHEAMMQVHRDRAFDRLDENKDGVLSKDELPSPADRLTRLDADGDGKVTPEEMRAKRPAPAQ